MLESLRPVPRLCVLTKPSGGHEYGFNLHAERGRGQFVGAVDAGSAADMASLQPNDHIVAVNTKSIEGLSHKEVANFRAMVRCTLLVLDEEGVLWLKERNLPLSVDYLLDRLGGLEEEEHNVLNGDSKQHSTYYYEQAVDVPPQPTPRRKKPPNEQPAEQQPISQRGHYQQQPQLSPAAATSPSFGPYGTEESGSCSIALALSSSAGSPHSDLGLHQQQQQTPVQLLSSAEEVQQHHQEHHQQQQQQQQNHTSSHPQFQSAPIGTSSFVSAQQQPNQQQNQTSTFQQPPAKSSTSPSPTPPTAAAAIGRHAAVPLPPPATLLANGPKPRLCTLQKASPSQEFGFNLHAERGKGHFVGTVDADGIARRAGLETGQRIVGVNGRLVFPNSPHKEIVQLIKRDPLRTELLVASEEVDRFYAEYGLAFSYDYVQVYDGALQNGHGAGQPTRGRQMSRPSNGGSFDRPQGRQKRADSGDISQQPSVPATNSAFQHRPSLGQRPPTPTSTYTQPSPPQQNGAAPPMAVAVQIERRPDNMTSIEIGELEEPLPQRHIGIGTPPSSRCDEKSEKEEEPTTTTTSATLASAHQLKQNGTAEIEVALNGRRTEIDDGVNVDEEEKEEEHKHVIAGNGGGRISPPSSAATTAIVGTPQPQRAAPLTLLPLSIVPPSLHQQQHENKNPLASESPQSRSSGSGSPFEKRTFGSKDIFALNAKEARKAICGRKRDPRIEAHMTLEEKHRLILNL